MREKIDKLKSVHLSIKQKKILLIIFAILVVIFPFVITSTYILHIIILCCMYACLTLSLNLEIGRASCRERVLRLV